MKTTFLLIAILISIKGLAQSELAKINDPDGYTNIRIDKGFNCEIIDKFYKGDLFNCTPSSDDWWLVQKYNRKEGYIHKSRVIFIKTLSDTEIKKVIILGLDTLNKKRTEFNAIDYNSEQGLYQIRIKALEDFEMNIYNSLLNFISQQFCKHEDYDLLNKFLSTLIINQRSANESPSWTLGECYICYPDLVIQQIDKFQVNERKLLIMKVLLGFENVTFQEESKIKNYKLLKDKLDNLVKKAKL